MDYCKKSLLDKADLLKFQVKLYAEMPWRRIETASEEAHLTLHHWMTSTNAALAAELFDTFENLLMDEPIPWPGFEGSEVNRLSLSKYYMCAAYLPIAWAIRLLKGKVVSDEELREAAKFLDFSERAVAKGKSIAWTDKDRFVQTCADCCCR